MNNNKRTVSNEETASLMLELSMLLHSGISISDSLSLLEAEDQYKSILKGASDRADDGASLAECLRGCARFPAYVCGLLEVGEKAGRLEEALNALSSYYTRRISLEKKIRSALFYPIVMLVLMLVVIGVMLVKVLPIFDDVYASLGGRLTGVASGLLAIGRFIDGALPVLWAIIAVVVVLAAVVYFIAPLREKFSSLFKKTFGDRGIYKKLNNSKAVQAIAMGISSGMQPEEALLLAENLISDHPSAKRRCNTCRDKITGESTLGDALEEVGIFSAKSSRLLNIAQRSGSIDTALDKIAEDMSTEVEEEIDEKVSRIEPALVLASSLIVGLILFSVVLPLMHIMSAIG